MQERQNALQNVKTAGQFFHATNGGDAMNCSNVLCAFKRKKMAKKLVDLQKEKEACESFSNIKERATAFFNSSNARKPPGAGKTLNWQVLSV